jgi:hypothetical protein
MSSSFFASEGYEDRSLWCATMVVMVHGPKNVIASIGSQQQ